LDRAATGGGGADERGEDLDGEDGEDGGAGGAGLAFSTSGADVAYAGGGGGGAADNRSDDPGAPGEGGDGGGGDGGRSGVPPTPGFPGTGGGGGGGNNAVPGADGGSGIVVVRYPEPEPVLTCQAREFDSELGPEWETEAVSGSFGEPRAVDGVLRLTDATNDVSTRATILDKLPWDQNRVEVTFTYFAYGGSTDSGDGGDADGIAVTFSDASVTPSPGGFGGSLGYAQRETPQQVDGFNGGWLGIGLDEFGNYSSATEGRVGGDGFTPDGVAIRGDGSGQSGYEYIAGTDSLDDPLSNPTVADRSSLTPDRYRIVVDTTEEGTALVTVERDTTGTGDNFVTLLEEDVAGEQDTAPPDEVFLSFTGATGGETNFHEIDFLEVCANRGIEAAVDRYAVTGPGQALTCTTSTVTIEARDSDGDPIAPDAGTVLTLGSDTGRGTWVSLGSEGGDLRDSTTGDGAGEYEFPGDEASVDVGLDHPDIETDPEEVVIDVDDGSASRSSDPITVSRAGFRFLDDDTGTGSDIVSPQIADKPSNQGFGQSTIELQALEATDGDPTTCQGVFDDGDVVTVDMGAECRDPSACADTGPDLAVSGTPIATSDDNGDADAPGGFTGVDLEFGPESKAAIPLRYADAGSMRLYARYEIQTTQDDGTTIGSGEFLRGMSNSFLVRPFGFDIEAIDNPSASNSGGAVYEDAGADFDVRVTAVGWASGDDTEDNDGSNGPDGIPDGYAADANDVADNADLSDNNARLPNFGNETSAEEVTLGAGSWKPSPANGAANGTLSGDTPISSSAFANPANAAAGAARVTVAYDEVGIAELRADLTDGRYQDSDRNVPGRSPRGVGRFIPDRFVVSDNNPGFRDGTDIGAMWDASFTYMGQAFTYSDGHEPLLTVEAVNDGGNTTANYGGRGTSEDFWKLDTPARDYSDATAADTQADFVVDKGSAARTWDGTRADYDGRGTLRIRGKRPTIAGDYFVFARVGAQDDETRQTPFDALIDLTLPASGLTDPDGVCYQQDATGGCIDFTIDGDGADNEDESNREPMGSVATTELRYGRLVLESANGSEIAPIALPLRAEYWAKADTDADAGWRVNSDDSETTLDLAAQVDVTNDDTTKSGTSDIALADARNGGATELATNTADPVELVDGQANLIFAAPGENNTGWAAAIGKPRPVCESDPDCDLPIERRYLQYDWETDGDPSDGQVDDDPRGRATFGIFTGPASRVLLREIPPR
jgi:MSHA biogenesis protein MshQ